MLLTIAGHNGAGKSTFYRKYLKSSFGPLATHLDPDAIEKIIREDQSDSNHTDSHYSQLAQDEVSRIRTEYSTNEIAFSFETVFSDPYKDKLRFLQNASRRGHCVALIAIGLESAQKSEERVARRVASGGHDVPVDRINNRYPRVIANLQEAVKTLPLVLLVDNSDDTSDDDGDTFRPFALFENGVCVGIDNPPSWWSTDEEEQ